MSEIIVERIERTALVTLARPLARNALTRPVTRALRAAIDDANADGAVRCVALTGSGGHFCAGADLRSFQGDPAMLEHLEETIGEYHAVIRALVQCDKPTLALVDGAAVGFGADLALACDLRLVTTAAYIQEKFVHIGLMPDGGGTFWLPRLIGTARAMQAMLLGDKLDGPTLSALGVAVDCVEPSALAERGRALARRIEDGPPLAHREIKRAVRASLGDIEAALAREREGQLRLVKSRDFAEGVAAWMQKRAPSFEGA